MPSGQLKNSVTVTALSLACGALFPVLGYDGTLALVFGLPGVPVRPGTPVPTGPAYSKARSRSGEAPARAMFFHDAGRDDVPAGRDGFAFGMELTQIDGTTLELFRNAELTEEFGTSAPGGKPLLRLVGLLHSASRRWRAAVVGRYRDGENALADELEGHFGPGQLNLADRGFFSMDRWLRFAATGAHLLWRVKNGAKSVPFRTLKILKDGSELVLLRESSGMRGRRRKEAGDKALPSLPDTVARLACFTVLARALRARSPELARQEAWALLLAHNLIAGLAARAAALAGIAPGQVVFAAVLSLVRAAVTADTCCPHCGKRPASANAPTAGLSTAAAAIPPGRAGRQRTAGRTAAQRRTWISEPADYTITIVPSNLPKADVSPRS